LIHLVFTHLAAAILPALFFLLGFRYLNRKGIRRFYDDFWRTQSKMALEKIGIMAIDQMPEPPRIITDRDSINLALQLVSALHELGFFELFGSRRAVTEEEMVSHLGISTKKVRAAIILLMASEVITLDAYGYQLTEKARIYLLKESPFFVPLRPPVPPKQFIKTLRIDRRGGAVENWSKGISFDPERLAMQQHEQSFALGFALYRSGLLRDAETILDVAGGAGSVCIALALSDPRFKLEMIELPGSLEISRKMIGKYDVLNRITCAGMDMFVQEWPRQFDAVLFTNIFHDWDDDRCGILARKAFAALRPGGIIILQEALLRADHSGPLWTAHWSMTMSLYTRGRQFYGDELEALLSANGFIRVKTHPLLGYYSAVVGIKPRGISRKRS